MLKYFSSIDFTESTLGENRANDTQGIKAQIQQHDMASNLLVFTRLYFYLHIYWEVKKIHPTNLVLYSFNIHKNTTFYMDAYFFAKEPETKPTDFVLSQRYRSPLLKEVIYSVN